MARRFVTVVSLCSVLGLSACKKGSEAAAESPPPSEKNPVLRAAPPPAQPLSPDQVAEQSLGQMSEVLRSFVANKGRFPTALEELYVTPGYAPRSLQPPAGRRFVIDTNLVLVVYR